MSSKIRLSVKPQHQPDQIIEEEELRDLDFHYKRCLVVESHMGTGKTKAVKRFLNQLEEYKSVLVITYRRSLVRKYYGDL